MKFETISELQILNLAYHELLSRWARAHDKGKTGEINAFDIDVIDAQLKEIGSRLFDLNKIERLKEEKNEL